MMREPSSTNEAIPSLFTIYQGDCVRVNPKLLIVVASLISAALLSVGLLLLSFSPPPENNIVSQVDVISTRVTLDEVVSLKGVSNGELWTYYQLDVYGDLGHKVYITKNTSSIVALARVEKLPSNTSFDGNVTSTSSSVGNGTHPSDIKKEIFETTEPIVATCFSTSVFVAVRSSNSSLRPTPFELIIYLQDSNVCMGFPLMMSMCGLALIIISMFVCVCAICTSIRTTASNFIHAKTGVVL